MEREEQLRLEQQLLESGVLSEESTKAIKADFPELAESEDERIRKKIIDYLHFAESHNLLRAADYKKKKGWLTYLEKQKPNIEFIQRSWYMEGYYDRELSREPKWIIKTGEGGPKFEKNEKYGQPLEQKPAEWSGEDEDIISVIETALGTSKTISHDNYLRVMDWLKSLRPQPHWKPSAEQMKTLILAQSQCCPAFAEILQSIHDDLTKL